eukprot:6199257-Pleurochrysis_carterae.AAC.2
MATIQDFCKLNARACGSELTGTHKTMCSHQVFISNERQACARVKAQEGAQTYAARIHAFALTSYKAHLL